MHNTRLERNKITVLIVFRRLVANNFGLLRIFIAVTTGFARLMIENKCDSKDDFL